MPNPIAPSRRFCATQTRSRILFAVLLGIALSMASTARVAQAGVVFGYTGAGLSGGYRWDAAPRTVNLSGTVYERSLNGGLRYSVQGGSFQAFRDLFAWNVVPSVADFQTAVQQAFDCWTIADPATGFKSALRFIPDLTTPVVGLNLGNGGVDTRGAEIDLFGSTNAGFWDVGNAATQGETRFQALFNTTVTLTSGTTNYAANAIYGADIIMNSNAGAIWSLNGFRRNLAHEIGHAIGLGDVEGSINPGAFIDDNYDGTNFVTARNTLTNSWAARVNPLNPAASVGLSRYTIPNGSPGTTSSGVDLLMESFGLGIGGSNLLTNLFPLTNDEFGTRQFLYPFVPEPGSLVLATGALLGLIGACLHRAKRPPGKRREVGGHS